MFSAINDWWDYLSSDEKFLTFLVALITVLIVLRCWRWAAERVGHFVIAVWERICHQIVTAAQQYQRHKKRPSVQTIYERAKGRRANPPAETKTPRIRSVVYVRPSIPEEGCSYLKNVEDYSYQVLPPDKQDFMRKHIPSCVHCMMMYDLVKPYYPRTPKA